MTFAGTHRIRGDRARPAFLHYPPLDTRCVSQPTSNICFRRVDPYQCVSQVGKTASARTPPHRSSFTADRPEKRCCCHLGRQHRPSRALSASPVALLPFKGYEDRQLGIVITGGSKGVGFALAVAFLSAGDNVVICSRDAIPGRLALAVEALNAHAARSARDGIPLARAFGVTADVAVPADVEALAKTASELLGGRIDCWINNAAQVGTRGRIVDLAAEDIVGVVTTNLLGTLLCCRQAEQVMRESGGHVFCMDGAGSGGNATATYVAYGSTKRAIPQMVASLAKELRSGKVRFHVLSPGMVLTDLLLRGNSSDKSSLRFFNFLAEEPDTVAADLAPRVRNVVLQNGQSSEYIKFLTLPRAFAQIVGGFLFGIRAHRYFDKDGKRVGNSAELYSENGVRKQYNGSHD